MKYLGHKRPTCLTATGDGISRNELNKCTVVRRLTMGINSEKRVVRRFRHCANVIECTYTNLDSIAYYTPSIYDIAYCS